MSKKQKLAQTGIVKKEIEILSRLRHPNLVQIMAYNMSYLKAFIIMEFVNGYDLESLIFPDEELSLHLNDANKISISVQISQGLSYLHGQKVPVIHQDIKPANILVSDSVLVKICDLGISRIRTMNTLSSKTVKTIEGTPVYMAPECVMKQQKTSTASDMWSYGCTICELFTCKDIWDLKTDDEEEDDLKQLQTAMEGKQEPHGLQSAPLIPHQILELVRKCLSYNINDRPTAIEVTQKLRHLQDKCSRCCKDADRT